MIDDISIDGEFFDPDFFVYREDADVAWRAQLLGWSCIYTPHARGYHVRKVLPGNRRALPAGDQHALGEEPLPDADEEHHAGISTGATGSRLPRATWWCSAAACCREHTSLKAFWYVATNWRRVLSKAPRDHAAGGVSAMSTWRAGSLTSQRSKPAPKTPAARQLAARRTAVAQRNTAAHEDRHRRDARHPGALRRLRNLRRGTFHAASSRAATKSRSTAGSGTPTTYLPAASGSNTFPPSATSISTRSRTPFSPRCTLLFASPAGVSCTATRRMRSSPYCRGCSGMPVALNVDGLERKRKKWNALAQGWYLLSEWLATFCPLRSSPMPRRSQSITASATARTRDVHPLRRADRAGLATSEVLDSSSGSSRAATSSTSAAWSRRTTPCSCGRPSSKSTTDLKLALIGDAPYAHEYIAQRPRHARSRAS